MGSKQVATASKLGGATAPAAVDLRLVAQVHPSRSGIGVQEGRTQVVAAARPVAGTPGRSAVA